MIENSSNVEKNNQYNNKTYKILTYPFYETTDVKKPPESQTTSEGIINSTTQDPTNYQKNSSIVTYYYIIFLFILVILFIIFCYCLHKLCRSKQHCSQESVSIEFKQQKDLRNGKMKKKHVYNPYDHMNTCEKEQAKVMRDIKFNVNKINQARKKVNITTVMDNNQPQIEIDKIANLEEKSFDNPFKINSIVKKKSYPIQSFKIKDETSNEPPHKDSKKVAQIDEPQLVNDVYLPTRNISIKKKVQVNNDKPKIIKKPRIIEKHCNSKELKDTKLKTKTECTCYDNHENKKTVTFTTIGGEEKWKTMNANDTISNFSFQISSRNSN
ncbi:Hypothetical protein SRAE_2000043000 [Strongyloides ratti]|uniref:Uncharacterized protein n=1 Tax=Strongyloides ratti TaxID=34506 RepID=A0A090MXN7_STRRB|nr:Hypothetical protein SRAE_2000043000 [Strongyloides ratti]CEF65754.1 Hypothetical protein SRAE_2000043000 [Strongyloides ratti]